MQVEDQSYSDLSLLEERNADLRVFEPEEKQQDGNYSVDERKFVCFQAHQHLQDVEGYLSEELNWSS
jgi:hypothetical protein